MRLKRRKSKPKEGNPKAADTVQASTLVLPRKLIVETHEYFLPYWSAGVESACFWFGVDLNDQQIVTSLALPKLYQTPGIFSVDKNSMRRLSLSMAHQGLTNLAQIHTHPAEWVAHSPFDMHRAHST